MVAPAVHGIGSRSCVEPSGATDLFGKRLRIRALVTRIGAVSIRNCCRRSVFEEAGRFQFSIGTDATLIGSDRFAGRGCGSRLPPLTLGGVADRR